MHRWIIYTTAMVILILFTTPLEMAEGKTIVMEEKNVKIRPGSMLKMKLNGFTKGASARIQVAVNQKMCNRTVNVYLAYSYQLVGTSPDELHYKQCPISRENATNVDVNYVNEDGKEYYFVVANVEKFAGERDLPGGDAVVSYKIEITPPEKEKSSFPTIIIGIVVLLVFLVIAVVLIKKIREKRAYQSFYPGYTPAQPGVYPSGFYQPTPPQVPPPIPTPITAETAPTQQPYPAEYQGQEGVYYEGGEGSAPEAPYPPTESTPGVEEGAAQTYTGEEGVVAAYGAEGEVPLAEEATPPPAPAPEETSEITETQPQVEGEEAVSEQQEGESSEGEVETSPQPPTSQSPEEPTQ